MTVMNVRNQLEDRLPQIRDSFEQSMGPVLEQLSLSEENKRNGALEWVYISYCLYNGVKTLAFQAKPLGQPLTSKFRKKKCRDTKLEVKKWKTIGNQHIVRMISNTI